MQHESEISLVDDLKPIMIHREEGNVGLFILHKNGNEEKVWATDLDGSISYFLSDYYRPEQGDVIVHCAFENEERDIDKPYFVRVYCMSLERAVRLSQEVKRGDLICYLVLRIPGQTRFYGECRSRYALEKMFEEKVPTEKRQEWLDARPNL
jgi:hypothetical protein